LFEIACAIDENLLRDDRMSVGIRDAPGDNAAARECEVDVLDVFNLTDEHDFAALLARIGRQKSRSRRRHLIIAWRNVRDAIKAVLVRHGPGYPLARIPELGLTECDRDAEHAFFFDRHAARDRAARNLERFFRRRLGPQRNWETNNREQDRE
jgi:hypothetical protein